MTGLFIGEKPSITNLARNVYRAHRKELEPIVGELDFAPLHGHIMRLLTPEEYDQKYASFDKTNLPIFPPTFLYTPDDIETFTQLKNKIESGKYGYVINGCDAGREGELIFYSFYEQIGSPLPVKRFWADSTTESCILKCLKNLLPGEEKANLAQAAKYRQWSDWLVGMNFSRAAGKPIGRVMTPVENFVYIRENEILNFKPEAFHEVSATFSHPSGTYSGIYINANSNSRLNTKAEAEAVKKTTGKEGVIAKATKETISTKPPTLYSQTELQKDANKFFKFSPDKTLDISQKLYEDGYMSYPRTGCRVLPSDLAKDIQKLLNAIRCVPGLEPYIKAVKPADIKAFQGDKDYVNDAELEDHYAVTPTEKAPDFDKLSPDCQKIYALVAKRLLSCFCGPYCVDKTTLLTTAGGNTYKTVGKAVSSLGFIALYDSKPPKDVLPALKKGDKVEVKGVKIRSSETKPPPRYTPKTLLSAMLTAGDTVSEAAMRRVLKETHGIGTDATRAALLKKLTENGFMDLKNNTYFPTPRGMAAIKDLEGKSFLSAKITAEWEQKLRKVADGTYKGDFMQEMKTYVTNEVRDILSRSNVGVCPMCGKPVVVSNNSFWCEGYVPVKDRAKAKNPCSFYLSRSVYGVTLTFDDIRKVLKKEPTEEHLLTYKSGKQESRRIKLKLPDEKDSRFGLEVDFGDGDRGERVRGKEERLGKCPSCGGDVYEGKNFYICSNRGSKCSFCIRKTIKGANIPASEIKKLLAGKESKELSFTWSNGKQSKAKLKLGKDGKLEWIFQNNSKSQG